MGLICCEVLWLSSLPASQLLFFPFYSLCILSLLPPYLLQSIFFQLLGHLPRFLLSATVYSQSFCSGPLVGDAHIRLAVYFENTIGLSIMLPSSSALCCIPIVTHGSSFSRNPSKSQEHIFILFIELSCFSSILYIGLS